MNNNRQIIQTALPSETSPVLIVIDKSIVDGYVDTLRAYKQALDQANDEHKQLRQKLAAKDLLTEKEAQEYLGRNSASLGYYRTRGLQSYKKGKDRWYSKADIETWLASGKVSRHSR